MSFLEPIPKAYANVRLRDLDKAFEKRQQRIRRFIFPNVGESYLKRHIEHLDTAIDKLQESIKEAQGHIEELKEGARTLYVKESGFYVARHVFDTQRKPWIESFQDNIKWWTKVIELAKREKKMFQRELKQRKPKKLNKNPAAPNIKKLMGFKD